MRSSANILFIVFAIPIGAFAIVAGESDDSPGLQGLGLLLLLYVFFRSLSHWRKIRSFKKE